MAGGAAGEGRGVLFELSPGGTETLLYSFGGRSAIAEGFTNKVTRSDGANPNASLIADGSGNLYGTTAAGGVSGLGVVFKLSPPATSDGAWTETVLHSFGGGSDGGETPLPA